MLREYSRPRGLAAGLLVLVCFVVHAIAGVRGVDFGECHWDEPTSLANARYMLDEGVPLPRHYMHPTASILLLASLIPELAFDRLLVDAAEETAAERRPAVLRARMVFSVLTSTVIIAAALAAFSRRRSLLEAVVAAGVVAGSFELSTHGRFLVPDGLLTASTAWALCASLWSLERPRLLWIAAVFAGVAAGTKYSGVVVIAPVLLAACCAPQRTVVRCVAVVGVAGLAFVITTPGILVEPQLVIGAFEYQQGTYAHGFYGYSIANAADRAIAIIQLLTTALLSNVLIVAIVVAVLAFAGIAVVVERSVTSRRVDHRAALLLSFIGLWSVAFWLHPAHFARNYLPLIAPLAIFAALAVEEAVRSCAQAMRAVTLVTVGGLIAVSIVDVHLAAGTINDARQPVADLLLYVDANADENFLASSTVVQAVGGLDPRQRENLILPPASTQRVLALPEELLPMTQWGGGDTMLAERVFGPREINWNLYPTWGGPPRVVLMTTKKLRALGADSGLAAQQVLANQPPMPGWLIKSPAVTRAKP